MPSKKNVEAFRQMNRKQKVRYILDYYKGWIFAAFALLLLFYYVGDMIYQSNQVIDLQGFFVNDEHNLFSAAELTDEFSDFVGTPRRHRIAFEDSLFVDLNSGTEYHAASQSKIVAYIAARELDFLVVPGDLAEYYAQSFSLRDLREVIPSELLQTVSGDLLTGTDGTGTQKAGRLDLKNSRFLAGTPYGGEGYCLMVLDYTKRGDAVTQFLRYAYEIEN